MKWARSFRKRYNLALRKPTPLSEQRRLDAAMLRELKQYFKVHLLLPAMQMQWGGKDSNTFLQTPWRITNPLRFVECYPNNATPTGRGGGQGWEGVQAA